MPTVSLLYGCCMPVACLCCVPAACLQFALCVPLLHACWLALPLSATAGVPVEDAMGRSLLQELVAEESKADAQRLLISVSASH